MFRMTLWRRLWAAAGALAAAPVAAAALASCTNDGASVSTADDPTSSTAVGEIKNGTPWDPWTQSTQTWTRNVVTVTQNGLFCTGTLLDYEWVMTAGHCFGASPPPANQVQIQHKLADGSVESSAGAELIISPDAAAGVDIALVRVATPLHPGVATLPLYQGTTASLVGDSVFCAGYGAINVGPSCSAANPSCPSGQSCDADWGVCLTPDDGTLRTATFSIIADPVDASTWYRFSVPNASGQIELPGDSGSSCWNGSALTGVNKAGNATNYDRQTSVAAGRDWIQSLVTPTRITELNRPGARCTPAAGATLAYTASGGANAGASAAVMICPVDRPIAPVAATEVRAPIVWVLDQSTTGDVCCHLQSSNPSGALISGAQVCSSGASAAIQALTLPSIVDGFTFSQFSISCTVPGPSVNGAQSGVDSYRADLLAR